MKPKTYILAILSLAMFFSCSSNEKNENENYKINITKSDTIKIETEINSIVSTDTVRIAEDNNNTIKATKYICPQGDKEGNLNKAGICPVCEMELIENPDYINSK